jgi:hypothetical protein
MKGLNVDPIAQPAPTDGRTSRWQAPRSPAFATIGGHGDPWLFVWFLKWDQVAVAQAHSPLVSQYLNVPAGVNLM